jgi:hypothetical protein
MMDKIYDFLGVRDFLRKPQDPVQAQQEQELEAYGPKEVYLSWEAPMKVIGTGVTSKRFIRTFLVIAIVIGILLAVMQDFVLIICIASAVFVTYVFSKYQLGTVKFELSNVGVLYDTTMFKWSKLSYFFFSNKASGEVLVIDTKLGLPGRLFINFNPSDRELIKSSIEKHLTFIKEEPKSSFDRAYDSITSKFNLEDK